jgi:hypothetical protein
MSSGLLKMCETFGVSPEVLDSILKQRRAMSDPVDAYSAFNWMNIDAPGEHLPIKTAVSKNALTAVNERFPKSPTSSQGALGALTPGLV